MFLDLKTQYCPSSTARCDILAAIFVENSEAFVSSQKIRELENNRRLALVKT